MSSQSNDIDKQSKALVPSLQLLRVAQRSRQAVAALNFYNAETLLAHVRAANAVDASIILQTTESTIDYLGLELIVAMANAAAELMHMASELGNKEGLRTSSLSTLRY